jgi:hypothetical protein
MIYKVSYETYSDGSTTWSIKYLPFVEKICPDRIFYIEHRSWWKEWSTLVDSESLNLKLSDDIIEPVFAYGKRLILQEIYETMRPSWRDELGKVRL